MGDASSPSPGAGSGHAPIAAFGGDFDIAARRKDRVLPLPPERGNNTEGRTFVPMNNQKGLSRMPQA